MQSVPNHSAMQGARLAWSHRNLSGLSDRVCALATPQRTSSPHAAAWMRLAPALLATVAAIVAAASGLDLRLADALYAGQGGHWSLRAAFATERLLHVAGRNASAALWIAVVIALAATWRRPAWRHTRRPLACLALSVLLATALVAWIKSWSGLDCPWDLARYGGERPYVGFFSARSVGQAHGGCFPAGHASGGYAWMASYFFFVAVHPAWRRRGLVAGMALGLMFGVSQQLRGAHFLSHDLWAAALCWLTAVAVHVAAGQPMCCADSDAHRDGSLQAGPP